MSESFIKNFNLEGTKNFFRYMLHKKLPCSAETQKMAVMHYCILGLDIMESLKCDNEAFINYIYSNQINPKDESEYKNAGFIGGSFMGNDGEVTCEHATSNLAMTYTALTCLLTLGDDLERVNKEAIIGSLKCLQSDNGGFRASHFKEDECDLRFCFSACAISYILNDWTGIDKEALKRFIRNCWSMQGSYGLMPECEGHGGSTYCAVACLYLMDEVDSYYADFPEEQEALTFWLVDRVTENGIQGRPGKPWDTCYSFWIGASLKMLNAFDLVDYEGGIEFIAACIDWDQGGFGKQEDAMSDPVHSFFSVCGLSFFVRNNPSSEDFEKVEDIPLKPLSPCLQIGTDVFERLKSLHESWVV
eukprot:TRINITY_DN1789_c0_g1_i1.p1 TRINITY_DN1789_c0_g1~~TRINITY_DN1789_c0_g1_i1.p1  ORF type:complete len:360 (+),score=87.34 TRINITY_DN1789_c0_g1_i1:75-1154(+)